MVHIFVQNVRKNMIEKNKYMDSNKILKIEFEELHKALNIAKHDYHCFALATTRLNIPQVRTVVLRSVNKKFNSITFHTDLRSQKINEINLNNEVSALFYDKKRKIQLRIIGKAYVEKDSTKLKNVWSSMKPESKLCYMGPFNPSKELDSFIPNLPNHNAQNISDENNNLGYEHFCRITIKMENLEWLKLHHTGHKRILYSFIPKAKTQWIAT